jgi:hypothetical protein
MHFAEWTGLAALVVGIVVLPTLFQMVWGRPHLSFRKRVLSDGEQTGLALDVFNYAVENKFLIAVGVRKEVASVTAVQKIRSMDTGKFLFPAVVTPRLVEDGAPIVHRELPPGFLPMSYFVVRADDDGAVTWDDEGNPISLHTGTYRLEAIFWVGEKIFPAIGQFVVTVPPKNSYWVS